MSGPLLSEIEAALNEVDEYLAKREDVIDGDYGSHAPNEEMTLLREINDALISIRAHYRQHDALVEALRTLVDDYYRGCSLDHRTLILKIKSLLAQEPGE